MKQDQRDFSLPPIEYRTHKVKSLMNTLKQKRAEIQQRVMRTQQSDDDISPEPQTGVECQEIEGLRKRVITEVPAYAKIKKIKRFRNIDGNFLNKTQTSQCKTELENCSEARLQHIEQEKYIPQYFQSERRMKQLNENEQEIKRQKTIQEIFHRIPRLTRKRNQQNTLEIKNYLTQNNMFFMKVSNVVTSCFIKLNRFLTISKGRIIYHAGDEKDSFYILIGGKVKLVNSDLGFKKICVPGETIGEEIVFIEQKKIKRVYETVKTLSKTYLVEVKLENYKKMCEQMLKFGYKVQFFQMQSIIKRNYISKNWLRCEKRKFSVRK